ncbi:SemiSWEET transporter [Undibacterium sp.]|jgi:MtN3 and saliva related transmembrane protein|uniref:SemiSWEET transporter n=1 Tax=Undibacterium sp. TaxID=1914977 RepID=UPI002BC013DE|nr:SemiSWEET transporter [Undibacterium sp.]HTD06563.1 SemiSWEET transporter [Undibacterium sp.]
MSATQSDLIGYLAACMTTIAYIPQVWLTWRRKRAEGVSLSMYLILTGGVALWLAYGVLTHSWPIIVANFITFVLALFILGMKLLYK